MANSNAIDPTLAWATMGLVLGLVLASCTSTPGAMTTSERNSVADPTPVIVDYSPTVSDVGGLMYLLAHPDVEVIAVSLPVTGEAGCDLGHEVTSRILTMFDQEDTPVACDPMVPTKARQWPAPFLDAQDNLGLGLPTSTALPSDVSGPDLIATAAAEAGRPVVLYAVAPLTNVARALDQHPELAENLERIVIMGGAVDVPGNVQETHAEWNFFIDVPAAATVLASDVPVTLVPLDATNDVPVPGWYRRALSDATRSDAIVYLEKMVRIFPATTSGFFYFWDELAAAVITDPNHVTTEEMTIRVVEGGRDDGRTVASEEGHPTTVAVGVPDPEGFYGDFLEVLAGSPVAVGYVATPEEEAYLHAFEDALSPIAVTLENLSGDPAFDEDAEYDGLAVAEAESQLLSAGAASYEAVAALSPPSSLQDIHDNYLQISGSLVDRRDEIIAAATEATSFEEFYEFYEFIGVNPADACRPVTERAAWLGVEIDLWCD